MRFVRDAARCSMPRHAREGVLGIWKEREREREREGESRGTCKIVWPGACSCGMLHGVSCHGMLERVRLGIGEREREGENGYV